MVKNVLNSRPETPAADPGPGQRRHPKTLDDKEKGHRQPQYQQADAGDNFIGPRQRPGGDHQGETADQKDHQGDQVDGPSQDKRGRPFAVADPVVLFQQHRLDRLAAHAGGRDDVVERLADHAQHPGPVCPKPVQGNAADGHLPGHGIDAEGDEINAQDDQKPVSDPADLGADFGDLDFGDDDRQQRHADEQVKGFQVPHAPASTGKNALGA